MNPYVPDELPLKCLNHRRLFGVVGRANAELARYDGLLQGIVNPAVLLSPLTRQEAILSSRIEGTQATVDQVLKREAGMIQDQDNEEGQDIREILNYRSALWQAADYLEDRSITLSLIRQMHKELLNSVRGSEKSPGEFRNNQNWIGIKGTPVEEATFVPPDPLSLLDHLQNLEKYIESEDIDHLVQVALVHAQFELLHPFNDGNGRIGRLLIPLFLFHKKKLRYPMFYLSGYLEKERDSYYHKLQQIATEEDWNGWIEFFLEAIIEQAKENSSKVRAIMKLYDEMKEQLSGLTHSQYNIQVLDAIFTNPMFQSTDFIARTSIKKRTALHLILKLKKAGILTEIRPAQGSRPQVLLFKRLLSITES
jgi:cell filamentation protein, protein adenylyltransferase